MYRLATCYGSLRTNSGADITSVNTDCCLLYFSSCCSQRDFAAAEQVEAWMAQQQPPNKPLVASLKAGMTVWRRFKEAQVRTDEEGRWGQERHNQITE